MATVALIGADGAGKSTICRRLEGVRSPPMKYIYMGDNPEASNYALPTTRAMQRIRRALGREKNAGGPPDPSRSQAASPQLFKRLLSGFKSTLVLMNRMGEEWFRQCLAWYYQRRGYVVLFDRHFFSDYYAHDIAPKSRGAALTRRLHGFVLDRLYPKPDLMIRVIAGDSDPQLVEFKVAQSAQLMEINGRVWGSLPLAVSSGVDFPRRLTELYLDDRPSARVGPILDYKVGVRSFNLELIVLWLPQVLLGLRRYPFLAPPKRSRALAALIGLLDPRQKFDVF